MHTLQPHLLWLFIIGIESFNSHKTWSIINFWPLTFDNLHFWIWHFDLETCCMKVSAYDQSYLKHVIEACHLKHVIATHTFVTCCIQKLRTEVSNRTVYTHIQFVHIHEQWYISFSLVYVLYIVGPTCHLNTSVWTVRSSWHQPLYLRVQRAIKKAVGISVGKN